MSLKEVTNLRKAGRLMEALTMACKDYDASHDAYSASALFWTLRVLCENAIAEKDHDNAQTLYAKMQEVYEDMDDSDGIAERFLSSLESKVHPYGEEIARLLEEAKRGNTESAFKRISEMDCISLPKRLKDDVAWILFYHLRQTLPSLDQQAFEAILEHYFELGITRPSLAHSQILNQTLKFAGLHPTFDLPAFLIKWGITSFRDEDRLTDPTFGLSLQDRAIRRCFINREIKLEQVLDVFQEDDSVTPEHIALLLGQSYYSILYKDSTEMKNKGKFFSDADEYVSRIDGVAVRNAYHSKILVSVMWELDAERIPWFKPFFEKWGGGSSFLEEDWTAPVKNGKSIPSTVEKALNKYTEALERTGAQSFSDEYKDLLRKATEKLKDNENAFRSLARVFYKEGNREEAIKLSCELIRTHVSKFYYWSDLAEFVGSSDRELCMACCSKALTGTSDEKYLGKLHLAMGEQLLLDGKPKEALCEIERYRQTCEENGWPVKKNYSDIRAKIETDTVPFKDNRALYRSLAEKADDFVYKDIEEHLMVLVAKRVIVKDDGKKRLIFHLYDSNNTLFKINPKRYGLNKKTEEFSCFVTKYREENGERLILSVKPTAKTEVLSYQQGVVDRIIKEDDRVHITGSGFHLTVPVELCYDGIQAADSVDIAVSKMKKNGTTVLKCLHLRKSAQPSPLLHEFAGAIVFHKNRDGVPYGIIDDLYIPAFLLEGIEDNDYIRGSWIEGANGKKKIITFIPF